MADESSTNSGRKPAVFIGSSVENLNIAYAMQKKLQFVAEPTVWDQGVFELSSSTLSDLVKALGKFQFAVLVLAPDDVAKIRNKNVTTARDNVIFELGLFIGRLGPQRTFFVVPGDQELHLPSDLAGVTPATYMSQRSDNNIEASLGPACFDITNQIQKLTQHQYPQELREQADKLYARLKAVLRTRIHRREVPKDFPLPENVDQCTLEELFQLLKLLGEETAFLPMPEIYLVTSQVNKLGPPSSKVMLLAVKRQLSELDDEITKLETQTN